MAKCKYSSLFFIVISICYKINSTPNTNACFFEHQGQLLQPVEFVVNNTFNGLFKLWAFVLMVFIRLYNILKILPKIRLNIYGKIDYLPKIPIDYRLLAFRRRSYRYPQMNWYVSWSLLWYLNLKLIPVIQYPCPEDMELYELPIREPNWPSYWQAWMNYATNKLMYPIQIPWYLIRLIE